MPKVGGPISDVIESVITRPCTITRGATTDGATLTIRYNVFKSVDGFSRVRLHTRINPLYITASSPIFATGVSGSVTIFTNLQDVSYIFKPELTTITTNPLATTSTTYLDNSIYSSFNLYNGANGMTFIIPSPSNFIYTPAINLEYAGVGN